MLCSFFYFLLIMVLVNQTSITIFRCIAAIFRAVVLSNVLAFIYIVRRPLNAASQRTMRCVDGSQIRAGQVTVPAPEIRRSFLRTALAA